MDFFKYKVIHSPDITIFDVSYHRKERSRPLDEAFDLVSGSYKGYVTIDLFEAFNLVLGLNIFPSDEITILSKIHTIYHIGAGRKYLCYELVKS